MPEAGTQSTADRLITAAAELFAARGFDATSLRDITARAGVNLAAAHYHYGSKKALYLATLRAQFAAVRAVIARTGTSKSESELDRLSRDELAALLRARSGVALQILVGSPPSLHATLMQREMCDPSEALPVLVEEFMRPVIGEVQQIIKRLEPELSPAVVQRCAFSIAAQTLFYRFCMPAVMRMMGVDAYPPDLPRQLAEHVAEFSLGGLERLARHHKTRRRRSGK